MLIFFVESVNTFFIIKTLGFIIKQESCAIGEACYLVSSIYFKSLRSIAFPIQSIQNCERYIPDRSSGAISTYFTDKNGKRLLELMNAVRDYANHICEDENYLDSVQDQKFVSWVSPIHYVSMIYACSLMGEEEIQLVIHKFLFLSNVTPPMRTYRSFPASAASNGLLVELYQFNTVSLCNSSMPSP